MARKTDDSGLLRRWLAETSRRSARQYAVVLRPLLRRVDAEAATADDLLDFVLAQRSESTRRKACTAMVAFFGDLHETGAIANDPSRHLSRRLRARSGERQRREALLAAGMEEAACAALRWSDVLLRLVVSSAGEGSTVLPDAPIVRKLEDDLLQLLGGVSRARFASLMCEPLT